MHSNGFWARSGSQGATGWEAARAAQHRLLVLPCRPPFGHRPVIDHVMGGTGLALSKYKVKGRVLLPFI